MPDAWCDNCEIIRAPHTGWVGVPEGLCHMVVLCSACYVRARIRHTRPSTTLQDLSELRWKCGGCDQWHTGPMLDLAFGQPAYWRSDLPAGSRWEVLPSGAILKASKSFLDEDYCAVDDESFFVRGLIHLPILGTSETFRWGAWGSLSRENFEKLLRADSKGDRLVAPPLFSWLSSQISDYPDTLSLKMQVHVQEPGMRPHFSLERCDHLLSIEYYNGISPERVRGIMFRHLPAQPD